MLELAVSTNCNARRGRCYAPAQHPLIFDMNIHDVLYSIQHDALSGLLHNEDTRVAKGASCPRGPVSSGEIRGMGSLQPYPMVALGGTLAYISPGISAYSDECLYSHSGLFLLPKPLPEFLVYYLCAITGGHSRKTRLTLVAAPICQLPRALQCVALLGRCLSPRISTFVP
jgi:hypothetical protein